MEVSSGLFQLELILPLWETYSKSSTRGVKLFNVSAQSLKHFSRELATDLDTRTLKKHNNKCTKKKKKKKKVSIEKIHLFIKRR